MRKFKGYERKILKQAIMRKFRLYLSLEIIQETKVYSKIGSKYEENNYETVNSNKILKKIYLKFRE